MFLWRALAVLTLALAGQTAAEEAKGPNRAASGTGARGGVAQLTLAQDLYALALARRDAQMALAAARLALDVKVTDAALAKVTSPAESAGTDQTPPAGSAVSATTMLDTARTFAGDDESLLTLIDSAASEHSASLQTAARTASSLSPGQQDIWKLPYYGATLAEIGVTGQAGATLHLRIADENDVTVCQASGPQNTVYCGWVPAWNGYFTVTITNAGTGPALYDLLSN